MKRIATRSAIAAAVAVTTASLAAGSAEAAPQAAYVDTRPVRVVQIELVEGQPGWADAAAARLLRSTFRFQNGGSFTFIQPGASTLAGRFGVSGRTARFSARSVLSSGPSGQTILALSGTLDVSTGRARIGYEASSILVFCHDGRCMTQRKTFSYHADLLMRRI
jgi:hypothetical protein